MGSLLYLLYTSTNNKEGLLKLYKLSVSESKFNVAFNVLFYIGDMEKCIDLLVETDKIPQAAMMSRAYCPSKIDFVTKIWKEKLQTISPSAASALGTPQTHPDCFPTVGDYVVNQDDVDDDIKYDIQQQNDDDVDDEKERNDIVDIEREIEQEQQQQYAQESVDETELTEELPSQQSQEQIASEIQTEEATDTNDIDLSDEVSLPSGMEDNESDILNGDDDDDDFNIGDLDDEL